MLFVYDKVNNNYLVGDTEDYSLDSVSKQSLMKAYNSRLEVRGLSDKGIATNWYKNDLDLNLDDIDIIRFKNAYPKIIAEHLVLKADIIYLLYERVEGNKLRLVNGTTKRFVDVSEFTILVNLLAGVTICGCGIRDNKLAINFNLVEAFKAKSNLLSPAAVNKTLEACGLHMTEEGYITNKGTSLSLAKLITEPQKLKVSDLAKLPNIQHIPPRYFNSKAFDTLSNIDVSKVTNMNLLFADYEQTYPDIDNWDVSNVEDMSFMFERARGLDTKFDVSKWNTKSLKTVQGMFSHSDIKHIDIKNWDLSRLENMKSMFNRTQLTKLDLSDVVVPNVTSIDHMFNGCKLLEDLNLDGFKPGPLESLAYTFFDIAAESLNITGLDTSKCKDFSCTFKRCNYLKKIEGIEYLVSSYAEHLYETFAECRVLTELNLEAWNTSNVKIITRMFNDCIKLKSLQISTWDMHNAISLDSMFKCCDSLQSLDVSKWDVGNVTSMYSTFESCHTLKSLDISNWNMKQVTTIAQMFKFCTDLKDLDVSKWELHSLDTMYEVFAFCSSLEELDLSSWCVDKVTAMHNLFFGCTNLRKIDIHTWSAPNCSNMRKMFERCDALQEILVSQAFADQYVLNTGSLHPKMKIV